MNSDYLREVFTEYLQVEKNASPYTVKFYQEDLDTFFLFLEEEGIEHVKDVDYAAIRVFLTKQYEQKLSRRSVSRRLSTLRTFYRFLEREEKVDSNPFLQVSQPKVSKPIPGFLYEEEIEKLFHVNDLTSPLGQRDQAILELLYATGMRVSECANLKLVHVDFSIGTVLVRGKGNKERYIPFGRYAQDALEQYIHDGRAKLVNKANEDSGSLFLNARGTTLSTRGFRLVLNKMVKNAALTINVHPHKLRHTFATHLLNAGADMRSVQELLGHKNLSSTQIYTHVTKDHLRNIYKNSHPRA
ncbi:tyrosine recombinase XerC [Salinibacillus aidingensis]|uniref:Tyrosine recombinase XerC n=1 Tax=Salinibacillus aidingensis TaxID=237684 RepID=A0ABP3LCU8_9BACI